MSEKELNILEEIARLERKRELSEEDKRILEALIHVRDYARERGVSPENIKLKAAEGVKVLAYNREGNPLLAMDGYIEREPIFAILGDSEEAKALEKGLAGKFYVVPPPKREETTEKEVK